MRMLMTVELPVEPFNEGVRNGTVGETMGKILAEIKPEAVYFTEQCGQRTGILVVNVENSSDIPRIAEPWFLKFNAKCKSRIAMTPEDLQRAGLDEIGKKWG
jgi:hypothetical protein